MTRPLRADARARHALLRPRHEARRPHPAAARETAIENQLLVRADARARHALLRPRHEARRPHPAADLALSGGDDEAAARETAIENQLLVRELARVQQRWTAWRDESQAHVERLEAELVRERARHIVKETQLAVVRDAYEALRKRAAVWHTNEELLRRVSDLRARNRSLEAELAELAGASAAPETLATAGDAWEPAANDARARTPGQGPMSGSVLCVGGRTRHIPVFRELVERRGARFAHASGDAADDPRQLERLLAEADLVVLQGGYVCQDACRAVEAHCASTGKRCLLLDKPCMQAFSRCLAEFERASA